MGGPSRWKVFLLVLLIAIVVAFGGALYRQSLLVDVPTDSATLCRADQAPPYTLAILLDISDSLTEQQRLAIGSHLHRIRKVVPQFGLLELYSVDAIPGRVATPLLHICNPGTGDNLSRWYANPTLSRRVWEDFSARVDTALDAQLAGGGSDQSPIFEAIQSVALRTFAQPALDAAEKHLVLVSDLIQNVPGHLSMYQKLPDFDTFATTGYFTQVRSDLSGVRVDVLYLQRRESQLQGTTHIRFWEQYFSAQGGRLESVERLFGDK